MAKQTARKQSPLKVRGFSWSGVRAGLKANGNPDVALLVAERPVPTAGVFTQNIVRAAPVDVAEKHVKSGLCQAVLVNSGNANAVTGAAGKAACVKSVAAVAKALQIKPERVVPASTGVIGKLLPADKIVKAVPELVLGLSTDGLDAFSAAILTTDRWPKIAHGSFAVGGTRARIVCTAKGAGMIHPNMATTLAFVALDANVPAAVLRRALREATAATFNTISVDGDTSTNDSIIAMASGAAGGRAVAASGKDYGRLLGALTEVLDAVALMIVADGEGAEHTVTIHVTGTRNDSDARKVAQTIATSPLVKTAFYGKDPNWGRILAAAGRAGVKFDPTKARISVGGVDLLRAGTPVMTPAVEAKVGKVMQQLKYTVAVTLGTGKGQAQYRTCDLGHGYVNVNADYRT